MFIGKFVRIMFVTQNVNKVYMNCVCVCFSRSQTLSSFAHLLIFRSQFQKILCTYWHELPFWQSHCRLSISLFAKGTKKKKRKTKKWPPQNKRNDNGITFKLCVFDVLRKAIKYIKNNHKIAFECQQKKISTQFHSRCAIMTVEKNIYI